MKKKECLALIFVVFIIPSTFVSADTIWSENFSNLDDWDLYGWEFDVILAPTYDTSDLNSGDSGFTIQSGVLTSQFNYYYARLIDNYYFYNVNYDVAGPDNISLALHDSTLTNGTWSFDLYLSNQENIPQDVVVAFMHSDPVYNWNYTGVTVNEIASKITGYGAHFTHNGSDGLTIKLVKYPGGNNIKGLKLPYEELNGMYPITVTRDLDGNVEVYFRSEKVFTALSGAPGSSDKFGFYSFNGYNKIANIEVSDTIDPPAPPSSSASATTNVTIFWIVIPLVVIYVFLRKKK